MGLDFGDNPINPGDPGGIFSGILAAIEAALQWLFNALLAVIQWIWNLLVAITNTLVSIFKTVGKFLSNVWNDFIKKIPTWLASHIQKIRDWIQRTLKPVVKIFQNLKKWYDQHILKQQLRMLQLIQKMRRFLGILRIFHIHWADKLDQALADVQNRIEKNIALVRGILNQIINTLALVLDTTLLVKRYVLGGSLLGNLGAIKRIFGYGDNRIASASEVATIDKDHSRYFASTVKDHINTLVSTGPTDDDKARRAAFQRALAAATNTPLPNQAP